LAPQHAWFEARNLIAQLLRREQAALQSLIVHVRGNPDVLAPYSKSLGIQTQTLSGWLDATAASRGVRLAGPVSPWQGRRDAAGIPTRIAEFGPLTYQNDDVLADRLGPDRVRKIKLLDPDSSRLLRVQDSGALYAYEIVNFVDGKRSVGEIRDAVAAEFGPIPLDVVADYLNACEEAKIIAFR